MSNEPSPNEDLEGPVRSRAEGSTLVLTLSRPDRLNAVSLPLYERLIEELSRASDDPAVRCVILTGEGRAFSVGADLKAHGSAGPPEGELRRRYVRAAQRANWLIQRNAKPVVAAVNGHAIGGGLEMALSADLMLVAEDAKLRFPEIALGTFIGGGVSYTLPARVGSAKARELLFLGEFFSGAEAAEMGLAHRAMPAAEVLPSARGLAERLAERAPISLAHAKRLLAAASSMPHERALRLEARALERIFGTRDWQEGLEAFLEKRPPRFVGE